MNALFLGGSFTSDGSLPEKFAKSFQDASSLDCHVQAHTFRQAKLFEHLASEESMRLVDSRPWDFVILQEQSKLPADEPAIGIEALKQWQQRVHPSTSLILMMTWCRREDLGNSERWYRHLGFFRQAYSLGVYVSPVGIAWEILRGTRPECILMQDDSSHANGLGAELSAVCLVQTIARAKSGLNVRQSGSQAFSLASATAHQFFFEESDVNA